MELHLDAYQEAAAGPGEDKHSPIAPSGTSTSNSIIAADQVMRAKSTVFHMVGAAVSELRAAGNAVGMSDWSYGRAAYDRELFWLGKVDASLAIAIEQLETARVRLGYAVDMARRIYESQQATPPAGEAST
jgi:hypothetical protein